MSDYRKLFTPADPQSFALRPLNKGMRRDLPPTGLPQGSFWTLKNYYSETRGVKRRAGWNKQMAGNQLSEDDLPLIDLVPLWGTDGTQKAVIITSRYLYQFALNAAPTVKNWVTSAGTISCGSTTAVLGSSTNWNSVHSQGWIYAGDVMVLSATESVGISTVNNDTSLTLSATPSGSYSTGTSFYIKRVFQIDDDILVDATVVAGSTNKVMMADYYRPVYTYDGTSFTSLDSSDTYCPACVLYFGGSRSDRLWIGNIREVDEDDLSTEVLYRQRIRWSSATDVTSFASGDYIDLPYASGAIKRLLNISQIMIVYMTDAIFYGRPSNDPDLPYIFDKLGTGGIGLVGPKAVVSHGNGHYFVGQDNIYYLDASLQLQPIGTPVIEETVRSCDYPSRIYACLDTNHDRVLFGFPESGEAISKIWSFNYNSKSWSYEDVTGTFIANPLIELGSTIDGLDSDSATIDGLDSIYPTIDSMGADSSSESRVYRGHDGYISELSDDGSNDDGIAISGEIQTGDLDFGDPDHDKTVTRLTVRLADNPSATLTFAVSVSDDGGDSWTSKGNLSIASNKREGKLDFRFTGSAIRFRLTSTSNVTPYTISEMTFRVVGRDLESSLD